MNFPSDEEILFSLSQQDIIQVKEASDYYAPILIDEIADILENQDNNLVNFVLWLSNWALENNAHRWSAFEVTAMLARTILYFSSDEDPEPYAIVFYEIMSKNKPDIQLYANTDAFWDAAALICSKDNPLENMIKNKWRWYATDSCPEDRYLSMLSALVIAIVSTFTTYSRQHNLKPKEAWQRMF
jgi:hypothetical protein